MNIINHKALTVNQRRQMTQLLKHNRVVFLETKRQASIALRYNRQRDVGRIIGDGLRRGWYLSKCGLCFKTRRMCMCHLNLVRCAICGKLATTLHEKGAVCDGCYNGIEEPDQPDVWEIVTETVESGKLPHITGKMQKIAPGVYLRNRRDGCITLYANQCQSDPIAMWGRDWDHRSSAYAGMWKLVGDAQRNYEKWVEVAQ